MVEILEGHEAGHPMHPWPNVIGRDRHEENPRLLTNCLVSWAPSPGSLHPLGLWAVVRWSCTDVV